MLPSFIQVVATSASRDALNSHLLIQGIEKLGLGVEIITGEQEVKMTFMGAMIWTPHFAQPLQRGILVNHLIIAPSSSPPF